MKLAIALLVAGLVVGFVVKTIGYTHQAREEGIRELKGRYAMSEAEAVEAYPRMYRVLYMNQAHLLYVSNGVVMGGCVGGILGAVLAFLRQPKANGQSSDAPTQDSASP